ncbi:MAG: hypothetical protein ACYC63_00885 [Armatimonadota bacterium]
MRMIGLTLLLVLGSAAIALAQEAAAPANATPAATAPKAAANLNFAAGKGYLKVTPETEALWKELGQIQTDLRQKEWELFTLMSAAEMDKQAVRAKQAEARELMKQMRGLREKLAPSWVPAEKKAGAPRAKRPKARQNKGGAAKPAPAAAAPGG